MSYPNRLSRYLGAIHPNFFRILMLEVLIIFLAP